MTASPDRSDLGASSELHAGGRFADEGWTFSGVVPGGAARVEAETSAGNMYRALCHDGVWSVDLPADDLSETVVIRGISSNANVVASERCLLTAPGPPSGLARRVGRWLRRHTGRSHRGWAVYGPR
jgi:hypothetical protein